LRIRFALRQKLNFLTLSIGTKHVLVAWGRISSRIGCGLSAIDRHPESCPIIFDNLAGLCCERFPYNVIYALVDNEIVVVACIHGARDPKRWQSRG